MSRITKVLVAVLVAVLGVVAFAAANTQIEPKSWAELAQYLVQIGVPLLAAIAIGFKNPKELLAKKTTWTGLSLIGGAIAALMSKSIDMSTAIYAIVGGFAFIFLRDGVASVEKAQKVIEAKQDKILKASELAASKERIKGF